MAPQNTWPQVEDQLGGDEPLGQPLLICLTAGLIWQFVLPGPPLEIALSQRR